MNHQPAHGAPTHGAPAYGALDLALILGGVRSGKSARALSMAQERETGQPVLFVATAQPFDDEMRERIAVHQRERPNGWRTLEAPLAIATDIDRLLSERVGEFATVIVDCLTLWTSNVILSLGEHEDTESVLAARASELIGVFARHGEFRRANGMVRRRWIVVSNEVGLGVVPATPLGRRYRDALGRVNQLMAAAASEVTLMVAGIGVAVKGS